MNDDTPDTRRLNKPVNRTVAAQRGGRPGQTGAVWHRRNQIRVICQRTVAPLALGVIVCVLGAAAPAAAACHRGDPAAPFVYVANHGSDTVSQFAAPRSRMQALQPLTPPTVATGRYPEAMAVSPDGHSAYIANVDTNTIGQYTINPATGTLRPKSPATVPTGRGANAIAISPDGKNAYAADYLGNTISQYTINPATGTLRPISPATVPAGRGPAAVAVSPDGDSAYVVNDNGNTITQYSIDPATGTLRPKSPATVPTGRTPNAIAITPNGKSAYVAEPLEGTVSQYSINPATGTLRPKAPATVPARSGSTAVAVTPNGKSAYAADGSGTISQYSIDPATGTLHPKTPATVPTGHQVEAIAITPDGKSAYLPSETANKVWQYSIDAATGKLSSKSPATVPAGLGSAALAVTPDADASVSMHAAASVTRGSGLTYTIKITDAGPSSAWRVMLTDHLPHATRFQKPSATGGRCSTPQPGTRGATITCLLGKITSGSSRTARIQVKIATTSTKRVISNTAEIESVTPDPLRSNNTATAHTKITK